MLNSVKWEYFKLEDLFEISSGKYMSQKGLSFGKTPFVTATTNNNGVVGFYDIDPIFPKNSITIEKVFAKSFYQPRSFYTTGDVNVLYNNKNINRYTGLFISSIISYNESGKWNYGRQCRIKDVKKIKIKLPIDSNGEPNWEFMEDYMKKISKGNLEGFNLPKNDTRLRLDEREWDEFKLENLFKINGSPNTTSKTARELIDSEMNNINYVTRSTYNNGVGFRLNRSKTKERDIPINKGKVIIVGAESTESFYQEEDFITGNKISILRNSNLNKYNGIFISTLIDWEFYRYSYGRGLTLGRLKNTSIKLPIKPKSSPDEKSEPDWEFMENYIKGLPYTNKL